MELKIFMSDKHHRYYKHTKFRQNPRGDPKFLVDLTWNDPFSNSLLWNIYNLVYALSKFQPCMPTIFGVTALQSIGK